MAVKRTCIICGARVRNTNPKTNTCQPFCTKAKHAKRTYQEQMEYELEEIKNGAPLLIEDCDGDEL